ncbi:hypothetical protein Lepto7375DRAFT_5518 [Leptolyngbya sp. PCC 7375]|nr:hypothetical protein Lepto7375DRAFT_5518 [Leptolyngbya sp. PCC 7375]
MRLPIQSLPVDRGISTTKVTQQNPINSSATYEQQQCTWAEYECHESDGTNATACNNYAAWGCTPNPRFSWNRVRVIRNF